MFNISFKEHLGFVLGKNSLDAQSNQIITYGHMDNNRNCTRQQKTKQVVKYVQGHMEIDQRDDIAFESLRYSSHRNHTGSRDRNTQKKKLTTISSNFEKLSQFDSMFGQNFKMSKVLIFLKNASFRKVKCFAKFERKQVFLENNIEVKKVAFHGILF